MGEPVLATIAAAVLAAQPAPDAECQLTYSAGPPITAVLRERGFAFETYDRLCAAVRRHGLELTITGASGVQAERAFGWVSLTARRATTGALSTREHLTTYLDPSATEETATDLLYDAVNASANMMLGEMDTHMESIEAEEARMRAALPAGR